MIDILTQIVVLVGSIFMLLAGVGVMRMPDLYMRLSTVTKGGTLGVFLLLTGVIIELYSLSVLIRVIAILAFGLVTGPVSGHVVSRAGYFQGVALWEGSIRDDLKGMYEMRHHELQSPEHPAATLAYAASEERAQGAAGPDDDSATSRDE